MKKKTAIELCLNFLNYSNFPIAENHDNKHNFTYFIGCTFVEVVVYDVFCLAMFIFQHSYS